MTGYVLVFAIGFESKMAARLGEMGQREKALAVIGQAVAIRRRLAQKNSAVFKPRLASSLHNLSVYLVYMGQKENALINIEQTVEIRRRLTLKNPSAFESDLASSLHQMSSCLNKVGDGEKARVIIEQAVEIWKRLVSDNPGPGPAAFEPELADSCLFTSTNCH